MKIYEVKAYKANGHYLASDWVTEDAIDLYKAEVANNYGKPVTFTVYDARMTADENGTATILAYTANGFRHGYSVTNC